MLGLLLMLLVIAGPCAVLYGCHWWYEHRHQRDWRSNVSKFGVAYATSLSVGICIFIGATPHSPMMAHFPYVYYWSPRVAYASLPCLLFAILAEGRIGMALAFVGFGGMAFAWARVLML
jgi:hypothetical protein